MSSAELVFYSLAPKYSPGHGQRRLYGGFAGLEFVLRLHFDSLHDAVSQQRCPFSVIKGGWMWVFFLQKLNPDLFIWEIACPTQLMQCVNFQTSCYVVEIPLAHPLSNYFPRRRSASKILICINCGGNEDN